MLSNPEEHCFQKNKKKVTTARKGKKEKSRQAPTLLPNFGSLEICLHTWADKKNDLFFFLFFLSFFLSFLQLACTAAGQ